MHMQGIICCHLVIIIPALHASSSSNVMSAVACTQLETTPHTRAMSHYRGLWWLRYD